MIFCRTTFYLFVSIFGLGSVVQAQSVESKLSGFSESRVTDQLGWEKKFDSLVDPKNLDTWMKFIASHPHHLGSAQGKVNADYIADLFKKWGYETEIETYHVLFPTPKERVLELLGEQPFKARLQETAVDGDEYSKQSDEQLPTYNAFSPDGDVTAEIVFVNRGLPADYDELEKIGVDVKGKIVLARYGKSWRGIKPKVAAEHGAIGCIIYSDPADDGYVPDDVYPAGPMRPGDGVERGSVFDLPVAPGDPLTPNIGSTKEAKRLDRRDAVTICRIPVQPISYNDALPFLKALKGPLVPENWRGGLPITYRVGPSVDKVHLKLSFNWEIKPIHNVIAKMMGSEFPDQWVMRGNHHDAWVNGAEDPVSGLVATMEEARVMSEIVKAGYKPMRTLVYCAWDGEEPGMLGSTEWAEDHQKEISEKVVIYINSDGNGRGFFFSNASQSLEPFLNEIVRSMPDPQTKVSVGERLLAKNMLSASFMERSMLLRNRAMRPKAIGAGSDYVSFVHHFGISCVNLGYDGEDHEGVYHSIYDSYNHFIKFIDPGFQYGAVLVKTAGRVTMRMASADVLPFDFNAFHKSVSEYTGEVKALLEEYRNETDMNNKMLGEKMYAVAYDPTKKMPGPKQLESVPFLNFSPIDNALAKLKETTELFTKLSGGGASLPADKQKELNEVLYRSERSLLQEAGLPNRPWYKHQIHAPGMYAGYGVKTLPAVREAIEQRSWKDAQKGIDTVAQTLNQYTQEVQKAIGLLK